MRKAVNKNREDVRWASTGTNVFIAHIVRFAWIMFDDPSPFQKSRRNPLNRWWSIWRGRLHQLKVERVPAVTCRTTAVTLKKSGIWLPGVGLRVIAADQWAR